MAARMAARIAARMMTRMAPIPGGTFTMGSDAPAGLRGRGRPGPLRRARRRSCSDVACVSNVDFSKFVRATGYETEAERIGWSYVFHAQLHPDADASREGRNRARRPVVAGGRGRVLAGTRRTGVLDHRPGEASGGSCLLERRIGLRGVGGQAASHRVRVGAGPRGAVSMSARIRGGTTWSPAVCIARTSGRGTFRGSTRPRTAGSAPPPWTCSSRTDSVCSTWRETSGSGAPTGGAFPGTAGRAPETRVNPTGPDSGDARVMRGGSFLCNASYCDRYRVSARTRNRAGYFRRQHRVSVRARCPRRQVTGSRSPTPTRHTAQRSVRRLAVQLGTGTEGTLHNSFRWIVRSDDG